MEKRSNYIDWLFKLEDILKNFNIELSDYDEFYINDAIMETEHILQSQSAETYYDLTESMIDEYTSNAIKNEPHKKDYYETISYYVKKRLLHI